MRSSKWGSEIARACESCHKVYRYPDEKIPGVHIAFGHPYAEHTGQDWVSTTHIDCVAPHEVTVWMDGEAVMRDGQFLI